MPTFYDYDMLVGRDGNERYLLRAGTKPLPIGYCTVTRDGKRWVRKTRWYSYNSVSTAYFCDLNAALDSGIAWARRRTREDASDAR